MEGTIYCGKESSFLISGMLFKPGAPLSRKALSCISSRNLKRLLADGTLVTGKPVPEAPAVAAPPEEPPAAPSTEKLDPVKKWNVDPVTLSGKDLQHLNIMVLERDPTMTPFETIEEAAAQLTKDFKGTK